MRTVTLLLATVILVTVTCAGEDSEISGVDLQVLRAGCNSKRLVLHWRITNNANRPIYVYSTFLKGPAAGLEEGDPNILKVHTSLRQKVQVGVNFYPKAEFEEIAPGATLDGVLADNEGCRRQQARKSRDVVLDVAYGFEVTQVRKALRSAGESDEHPANPIVDWRTLAHSEPTPLRHTTR